MITNVRIFDGETVKENAYVLIENGLISKVSTNKIIHNNVIDGTGKTLIPDMTNAHVHVWAVFSLQEAAKERVLNLLDIHRRGNART